MAKKRPCLGTAVACQTRLPRPELAGFTTWDALRAAAQQAPELRPCPRRNWWWIYRTACDGCEQAIF